MRPDLVARLGENVPRYTSYPTAPHFHPGVDAAACRGWLQALNEGDEISLYLHIPYCDKLCWFCACHTKQTRHYEPVTAYLRSLHAEISTVASLVGGKGRVHAVHFGGGSPTMLKPQDIVALATVLRNSFAFLPGAKISVEIEPNDMDEARLDALAEIGMTRASLGVQDFDPKVQKAINREQTFLQTKAVVDGVRSRGVESVNLDLLYGLPHQTRESVLSTVQQALSLEPDRIALFGYAHVPWFKKHQTMIDDAWLPGPEERFAQSQLAARAILDQGYEAIGLDHFAKPGDALALAARSGTLHRNFQGYTEDRCETLIGLGPSSISQYRQGYAQNMPSTTEYGRMVADGGLATVRGIAFSVDDRVRGWIIERLMCDFAFSAIDLVERFGEAGQKLLSKASSTALLDPAPMLELNGDHFVVPVESRPFVRSVAAKFDKYFETGKARHSVAV
ncbi:MULTISPECIES: oxygen-independent coproporphyrinogen III oxidase [unclassified Mesorhizobium]|uniref:oxygen-independent coproporphyrinogen III oxidase n=1 Tax=unclassified Mesorhizobium TaxID=325217 RepID=UPI000FDADB76|nr:MULTISPECIES: oxygen-independent coproporphyrinogen III oxidase [unclassified Mesorhizobium]TGR36869.1 oxygen-independent coproporphyrinogen III oxidase [bacterium M00.F.Ca.ET.199.01.1.1]TGU17751.1 oxygen-independent coproporphyrinogen III oxidase [bacterium M00.F.Ca.ET.156.01.1.1]TGV51019.1 oxygen-independent coproporphyrinogen III oxidase [bacterium M00.F.Ca.ET.141.01.1.1]TGV82009.1 oxygen-independent coproporphyrinogen III oxidase [Mesorhizobium sp. M00.F.Ca.ET.149.01.1.1]RWC87191.1 MAG: